MRNGFWAAVIIGAVAIVATLYVVYTQPNPRVVLYCAQDEPFARGLLAEFERLSGLRVAAKFDTEAAKSVGLFQDIVDERTRPRCDVFWNNELFNTIRLEEQGLLAPCPSPFGPDDRPIPPQAVSKTGTWVALGTRCRVLLINTDLLKPEEYPTSLLDLTDARFKGRVAMAKPLHGMSATQAACLFEVLGVEAGKKYYRDLKANGVQIVAGNKDAAVAAGAGVAAGGPVAVCVTDTDDALAEVRAGKPVKLLFPDGTGEPRAPRMGTIFVPNAVGIVKGCPNPTGARQLVENLLSPATETALATGESAQIPVRKALRDKLPAEMRGVTDLRPMDVDFYKAVALWDEVQTFLRAEFTPQNVFVEESAGSESEMEAQRRWHRLFGMALVDFFTGLPVTVEMEKDLSTQQQLLDVVVLRKEAGPLPIPLPDGFDTLADHNLISFKSFRESLDGWAMNELVGHYVNYRKLVSPSTDNLLPEDQFRVFAVTVRFPQNLGRLATLEPVQAGVYQIRHFTGVVRLVVVHQFPEQEQNALLHLFSAVEQAVRYGAQHYRPRSPHTSTFLLQLFEERL